MRLSVFGLLCGLAIVGIGRTHAETPPDGAGIQVELIDAGDMPHRLVRFTPQVGQKQTIEMTVSMQQQITLAGTPLPAQAVPIQKTTIELEVTDVSTDGDISYSFEYTDVKIVDDPNHPSPIAAQLQGSLAPMIGMKGSGVVSSRGITRKGELTIPAGLNPQLKQMLDGMKDMMNRLSSPLPAEPVGRGGKWRVVQSLTANGMQLEQTSLHQIEQLTPAGFEMTIEVSQTAKPQAIVNPMLPPGTRMMLDSLKSAGTGRATVEQASVLPVSSIAHVETDASMSIQVADQNQQMQMNMTLDMTIKPPTP